MNIIIEKAQDLSVLITTLVTIASGITAITNTPPNTTFRGKLYKIIEFFALVTEKTKQK